MTFCKEQFLACGAIMSLTHDRLLIGWGEPSRSTCNATHSDQPSFFFSDFFLTCSNPWIQYPHWMELTIDEFKKYFSSSVMPTKIHWCAHQPEKLKTAFEELAKLIKDAHLEKAVPYLFATSQNRLTKEHLCHALSRGIAVSEKKTGYLYGQWQGDEGILGLTPELLFSHTLQEPNKIHTMAVAGTCHPSQDHEAFFHNEKERHEHQLVVRGICQSLSPLGHVQVGALQLLHLPQLVHLMTPIILTLKDAFGFDALVAQLHPTPALGAFPVAQGKNWLEAFDRHTPRHYYGAPVGLHYPSRGFSRCLVAIRNVQWDPSGMRIGAGCGVVKQSTFEKEWKEIQIKIRAIREMFQL